MVDRKGIGWKIHWLVIFASACGMVLTTLLVEVVFGVDMPSYIASTLGFAGGTAASLYVTREKLIEESDPNSTSVRTRNTARLISDSRQR